jgi:hypothetical protein
MILKKMDCAGWDLGVESVRAAEREIISSIAGPVSICHKKAFVDFAKDLWRYLLALRGLESV